jgi:hypothetical protein
MSNACLNGGCVPRLPRSRRYRRGSVKPSAQPTLVRIQDLPPPAQTARSPGFPRPCGPLGDVSSCVIVGQEASLHHDGYGHIADGTGAGGAVHRTGPLPP